MARIEIRRLCKTIRGGGASRSSFSIDDLDLDVPDGQVLAVLGPSGCGKSTLLRLIAGLMPSDSGRILYDGVDMEEAPPASRKIGMVFQNYALYPNLDSRANVLSYFLFRKKSPELDREAQEKYRRTAELLGVEIEKLMDRMPTGLSGGEQQRVAIGRCITRDPRLFLLDEPFSNLDQKLREKYRTQLRVLLKQFGITTVYVTHDQVEALILADLIALMNTGRIEQVGTALQIYEEPRSIFAADFINFDPEMPSINLIDGAAISSALSRFTVGVRPEEIYVGEPGEERGEAYSLRGELVDIRPIPIRKVLVLCLRAAGRELFLRLPEGPRYELGSNLPIYFSRYHLFDKLSGIRVKSVRPASAAG
jgi:multiple sugar transport system ATP-binding protein